MENTVISVRSEAICPADHAELVAQGQIFFLAACGKSSQWLGGAAATPAPSVEALELQTARGPEPSDTYRVLVQGLLLFLCRHLRTCTDDLRFPVLRMPVVNRSSGSHCRHKGWEDFTGE